MSKFVKVMFGTTSGAKRDLKYKIGEVNISDNWNPNAEKGRDFGGFNYCGEECILRWLHRGDTIYDVEVPKDAENIKIEGATTIYRTNKIIIKNPRKVDDELALHFYNISNIPKKSYYKALGAVTIMGYEKTALAILRDKVNENNIDEVLEEWNDFIGKGDRCSSNELVNYIKEALYEIKDKRLITLHLNRNPYEKIISDDKIINITGESDSGKSTYTKEYLNNDNYIVIDTDEITRDTNTSNKNCIEFREYLKKKYNDNVPDICNEFSVIYNDILDYYKGADKTLVIDSAQFRNLRTENEIKLLKGKIIILRTSVNKCYKRVIDRWKKMNENYTEDDLIKYQNKKLGMYKWYKSLNEFIKNIDSL